MTGGARGIGNGIVRAFAQAGASKIAILDVRDELGREAAKEVGNEFPSCQVEYYHLDISNFDEVGMKRYTSLHTMNQLKMESRCKSCTNKLKPTLVVFMSK